MELRANSTCSFDGSVWVRFTRAGAAAIRPELFLCSDSSAVPGRSVSSLSFMTHTCQEAAPARFYFGILSQLQDLRDVIASTESAGSTRGFSSKKKEKTSRTPRARGLFDTRSRRVCTRLHAFCMHIFLFFFCFLSCVCACVCVFRMFQIAHTHTRTHTQTLRLETF